MAPGPSGALTVCERPRASRSRRTRWLSCGATWSADGLSAIKFGRSRRHASSILSKRPMMDRIMVRLLARVIGVGIETADMLVHEVLSRNMDDRRAIARYAGLTGSPDESGRKRREKGLARSGNGRVRRGMVQ